MNICKYCGKKTKNKSFCNNECSRKNNNELIHKRSIEEYNSNPNICLNCKKPILYDGTKRICELKEKKFCDYRCSAIYNNSVRGIRYPKIIKKCIICGAESKKILYKNKDKDFLCGWECISKKKKKDKIKLWKEGKINGTTGCQTLKCIREYLLEKFNNKCEKCGWGEVNSTTKKIPLCVHHKDGDWKNNNEKNLELLCPNCHSLTNTYGILNKGKGREDRKKRREFL